MPNKLSAAAPVTIADLQAAIATIDKLAWARDRTLLPAMVNDEKRDADRFSYERSDLFWRYSKQKPSAEAIPFLREALADTNEMTVRCAAKSLRKLGPVAIDAVDDLFEAAARTMTHPRTGVVIHYPLVLPQAYPECVEAIASIQPDHWRLVGFIKLMTGTDNWGLISASLRALKTIGTPDALELLRRIAAFWMPDLNKMQTRVVEQMLSEIDKLAA